VTPFAPTSGQPVKLRSNARQVESYAMAAVTAPARMNELMALLADMGFSILGSEERALDRQGRIPAGWEHPIREAWAATEQRSMGETLQGRRILEPHRSSLCRMQVVRLHKQEGDSNRRAKTTKIKITDSLNTKRQPRSAHESFSGNSMSGIGSSDPGVLSVPPHRRHVRTKLRLRNRFPNTAMEIFGRCGKMRVG
jgi:hypothetical protein